MDEVEILESNSEEVTTSKSAKLTKKKKATKSSKKTVDASEGNILIMINKKRNNCL